MIFYIVKKRAFQRAMGLSQQLQKGPQTTDFEGNESFLNVIILKPQPLA